MIFLAMYSDNVSIGDALFISAFAMLVVFVVLLSISYLVDATAFFINRPKRENAKIDNKSGNAQIAKENVVSKSDDTVVVIAAVVAAYLGTSVDNIKIKHIRRVSQTDSAWSKRALLSHIK